MNYIIFGGSGFIGTHLIHLLKETHPADNIYCLDIVMPGEEGVVPGIVEKNDGVIYERVDVRKKIDYEIETICLLSHAKGMSYSDYIINISNSKNLGAMYVKMADLLDNMNLNRLRQMTKKDIDRVTELYIPAYDRISTKIWFKENLNNQEKGNE